MVGISQIILADVWAEYAALYAKQNRPFIRANETQQEWIDAVNAKFADKIKEEKNRLFSLIPERFIKTFMYQDLKNKLK